MKKCSEKTVKILKTSALYFSFFALGLCLAIPGPTLLDLQQIVNTDTGTIAYIYLARSSAALVGSLVGGILFDIIKQKQLLIVVCNLIMALSMFITPWSRSVVALIGAWAVSGLALGALDTGTNVMCLKIWGKESPPYFQALHFLYGLGAFFAPLVAEPFLSNCMEHTVLLNYNESVTEYEQNSTTYNESQTTNLCDSLSVPPITYAYSIIGATTTVGALYLLILALLFPDLEKQKAELGEEKKTNKQNLSYTIGVAFMAQLILLLYCGIEIGYGQMLMTFAVKGDLKLTKSTASFVTALYWGAFTFFRGFSIFLTYKFSSFTLVFGDLLAVLVSTVILVLFGSKYIEALCVGTFILAVGCASFFPAVISWVETYVHVNNKIASLFVIAGTLGEMIVPLTVSQFIESQPHMLMYICLGCCIGGCATTFLLWLMMTRKGKKT